MLPLPDPVPADAALDAAVVGSADALAVGVWFWAVLGTALALAATLAAILVASAALQAWLGATGVVIATAVAGFADTHSAAVSAAQLTNAQRITAEQAVLPVLAAFSTNTVTKIVLAFTGHRTFALSVVPGLLLVVAAAWAGAFLSGGRLI